MMSLQPDPLIYIDMGHDNPYTVGEVMDMFECGDARIHQDHSNRCGKVKWITPGHNCAGQWYMRCPKCGGEAIVAIGKDAERLAERY